MELLTLFTRIQLKGVWPWQWIHVIIALIPKPAGGDRPIGLSPMLMRLFFPIHKGYTTDWTRAKVGL